MNNINWEEKIKELNEWDKKMWDKQNEEFEAWEKTLPSYKRELREKKLKRIFK